MKKLTLLVIFVWTVTANAQDVPSIELKGVRLNLGTSERDVAAALAGMNVTKGENSPNYWYVTDRSKNFAGALRFDHGRLAMVLEPVVDSSSDAGAIVDAFLGATSSAVGNAARTTCQVSIENRNDSDAPSRVVRIQCKQRQATLVVSRSGGKSIVSVFEILGQQ